MRKYKYITAADRVIIERLHARGASLAYIAAGIDCSLAALYRELPKGYTGQKDQAGRDIYSAEVAQGVVSSNIKRRGRTPAGDNKKSEV